MQGEIRRDDTCLDFTGSEVILYPCHGARGNQAGLLDFYSLGCWQNFAEHNIRRIFVNPSAQLPIGEIFADKNKKKSYKYKNKTLCSAKYVFASFVSIYVFIYLYLYMYIYIISMYIDFDTNIIISIMGP